MAESKAGGDGEKPSRLKRAAKTAMTVAPFVVGGGAIAYSSRPQDPILDIQNIQLRGFNLRLTNQAITLAVVDIDLLLTVRIVNPNVAPITFGTIILDIYYNGGILGQAKLYPGDQGAKSQQVLELPCTLNGLEATHHLQELFGDVMKREMVLYSTATINGHIAVLSYRHHFQVYLQSLIKVDPVFLDVIGQTHRADLDIDGVVVPKLLDK